MEARTWELRRGVVRDNARGAALLSVLLLSFAGLVCAGITTCADADGRRTYTQFGCPSGTRPESAADADNGAGRLSIIERSGLTDAERAAVERLEQRLAGERTRRQAARRSAASRRAATAARVAERCEEAQRALTALDDRRRSGYTAAEARRLDAEEARWQAVRKADC